MKGKWDHLLEDEIFESPFDEFDHRTIKDQLSWIEKSVKDISLMKKIVASDLSVWSYVLNKKDEQETEFDDQWEKFKFCFSLSEILTFVARLSPDKREWFKKVTNYCPIPIVTYMEESCLALFSSSTLAIFVNFARKEYHGLDMGEFECQCSTLFENMRSLDVHKCRACGGLTTVNEILEGTKKEIRLFLFKNRVLFLKREMVLVEFEKNYYVTKIRSVDELFDFFSRILSHDARCFLCDAEPELVHSLDIQVKFSDPVIEEDCIKQIEDPILIRATFRESEVVPSHVRVVTLDQQDEIRALVSGVLPSKKPYPICQFDFEYLRDYLSSHNFQFGSLEDYQEQEYGTIFTSRLTKDFVYGKKPEGEIKLLVFENYQSYLIDYKFEKQMLELVGTGKFSHSIFVVYDHEGTLVVRNCLVYKQGEITRFRQQISYASRTACQLGLEYIEWKPLEYYKLLDKENINSFLVVDSCSRNVLEFFLIEFDNRAKPVLMVYEGTDEFGVYCVNYKGDFTLVNRLPSLYNGYHGIYKCVYDFKFECFVPYEMHFSILISSIWDQEMMDKFSRKKVSAYIEFEKELLDINFFKSEDETFCQLEQQRQQWRWDTLQDEIDFGYSGGQEDYVDHVELNDEVHRQNVIERIRLENVKIEYAERYNVK